MQVLYEDNHLLVVNKPAGIATMGTPDSDTVYSWAGAYLKQKYNKPGNVFVGIVSRLDSFTSGVLVLARTSKSASRLSEQFRESTVEKTYLAVVEGKLEPPSDPQVDWHEWSDWVLKDESAHRMRTVSKGQKGAQEARLKWRIVRRWGDRTLVEVKLLTGRKHQIRVQFSSRGYAVWGDRKYDAKKRMERGIALHSCRIQFLHPTKKDKMEFTAEPPASWRSLLG
ncbi:Ribosomal large subunit pseudouridine synthase C [Roseimaritima multifibrata]|uniref:Ribosomal large subunit pseudouridine synthase C n=1 Tax=Roseimaritima multifibrata TaxID=1930274 RepID=A0A517MDZ5_9BACT|nr:RluA family pseudouridine synthase [Roseimaritima multifibrata]QDS93111.1 Ribosomal large subunit pseudouridine synthase C [Roseimaritima multifibrata]